MRKSFAIFGLLLIRATGCGGTARTVAAPPDTGTTPADPGTTSSDAGTTPADSGTTPPTNPVPGTASCESAVVPPVPERGWYPLQPDLPRQLTKVVPHPRDAQLVFAVALERGLWRSDDGGQRFCTANTPAHVTDVYPAVSDPLVVYARASTGTAEVLLRSADRGQTWQERVWPDKGSRLIVDAARADVLYLEVAGVSTSPLLRSLDGGATWSTMGPALPEPVSIWHLVSDPGNPDHFYGTGPCGRTICLWRRSEAAGSYQLMRREAFGPGVPAFDLVVDRASRLFRTVQAIPPVSPLIRRLERSLDGGATFVELPSLPGGLEPVNLVADPSPPGHLYVLATNASPSDGTVLESADGGESWTSVARGLPVGVPIGGPPAGALRMSSAPQRTLIATAGSVVFRFEPRGAAPVAILADPGIASQLEVAPSAPQVIYALEGARIYRSQDGGATWDLRSSPNFQQFGFAVDPSDADRLWGVFARSFGVPRSLFRSDDGGRSWQPVATPVPPGSSSRSLFVPRRAPGTIYLASSSGVLSSSDFGRTWRLTTLLDGVESLAVSESDPLVGYVVEDDKGIVYVTRDGFATLTPTTPPRQAEDVGLLVDPHDPQKVFLYQEDVAYRSDDGGQTWTRIPAPPDPLSSPLVFHPYRPGVVFSLGTTLQISEDGGTSWRRTDLGLPGGVRPHTLAFDPQSPTTLLTPLRAGGIWKTTTAGQ